MITFGLAPGIMMLVLLTYSVQYFDNPAIFQIVPENFQFKLIYFSWFEQMIHWGSFSMIPSVGLWITFLSMFRLAKFNIDTRQSDQFIGLNTPANTIFFTSFPLLMFADFPQGSWQNGLITQLIHPYILVPIIVVMSLLLISEIPLFALKFKHFKWKGNQIRFIFLITCSLIIPTCLVWSIPIIVILYILLSLIGNIIKKRVKHEI